MSDNEYDEDMDEVGNASFIGTTVEPYWIELSLTEEGETGTTEQKLLHLEK